MDTTEKFMYCWLAQFSSEPCDGMLKRCHLIPAQMIKREFTVKDAWDDRVWVWGCGGLTGIGGHHGMLDSRAINPLRIPYARLPPDVIEYAAELDSRLGNREPFSVYLECFYG